MYLHKLKKPNGDIYACFKCQAEGYSGEQASEEFDGGEWRIIPDYWGLRA